MLLAGVGVCNSQESKEEEKEGFDALKCGHFYFLIKGRIKYLFEIKVRVDNYLNSLKIFFVDC